MIYLADVWDNLHFSTKYSLNLYQLSHSSVEREREEIRINLVRIQIPVAL